MIRRSRGARRSRPKSPIYWDRFHAPYGTGIVISTLTAGPNPTAPVGSVLVDPTLYEANSFDTEHTIRRLRLSFAGLLTNTASVLALSPVDISFGIYVDSFDAPVRNPRMAGPADFDADWLALWIDTVNPTSNNTGFALAAVRSTQATQGFPLNEVDVKSQRRIGMNSRVILVASAGSRTPLPDGTFTMTHTVSTLWQRSLRK